MNESLFRQEVLAARQNSRFGQAVFYQPLTIRLMVSFLVVVFVSFLAFAASAELKQTERVRGYLTSTGGEVKIYGGKPGVLTEIFVEDGDVVKTGDILAAMSDPFYDHRGQEKARLALQQIDVQLRQLRARKEVVATRFEVQATQVQQQLQGMQKTLQLLRDEQWMRQQRVDLSDQDLQASRRLRATNTISEREFRQTASSQILLEQQAKTAELAIAKHLQAMEDARQQLIQLPMRGREEALLLDSARSQLLARRHDLLSQLKFTITASRDGIVSNMVSRTGDIIDTSKPLLTLLESDSKLEAWLYLPSRALANVQAGTEIMISYDAYPYQTYGSFPARILSVADSAMDPREFLIPVDVREPVYLVKAQISDQGPADGTANQFRPGMQFTADIVTAEQTVLKKLISPLRGLGRRL